MIDEVARLEAELETVRHAARSSRERQRDFLRRAEHDLKAPLRGLRILTSFLREDVAEDLDDDGLQLLDRLDARVIDMEDLVASLASYARCDEDEVHQQIDLIELIERAVASAGFPAGFAITVEATGGELHLPIGAASQCLRRVLENAWQHHAADAGSVAITATIADGFAVFVVVDDGPGIDDRTADHVFEPFRTGPPPPGTAGQRAGLGLATASLAAAAHGATIRLVEHRSGTTIEMRWPLRHPLPLG